MEQTILQIFTTLLPAIIVALLAFYFFNAFMTNEEKRRRFLTVKESQAKTLPTRMQAYERMVLFLERIKPENLIVRMKAGTMDKHQYEQLLIGAIEQEFEHNLTQQIYVSEEAWNVVRSAKNATIQLVRQIGLSDKPTTADDLRQTILNQVMDKRAPSDTALSYIREEVKNLF
jgi:Mg2+/citrate symporter